MVGSSRALSPLRATGRIDRLRVRGDVVVGLFVHDAIPNAAGDQAALAAFDVINLGCPPGPDGKLGLGDLYIFSLFEAAEVISCKDAPKDPRPLGA